MFRDTEHQRILWNDFKNKREKGIPSLPADEPGYSTHQCGCSFDIPLGRYTFKQQVEIIRAFEEYGFIRNRPDDDPVHFTFRAAADLYANKAPYLKTMIEAAQADYERQTRPRPRFIRSGNRPDLLP